MSGGTFVSWLVAASIVGFVVVRRAGKRLEATPNDAVMPWFVVHADADVPFDEAVRLIIEKAERLGMKLRDGASGGDRVIIDSVRAGAFHWGFLYVIEAGPDGSLSIGIHPKGANPPRGRRLAKYLVDFAGRMGEAVPFNRVGQPMPCDVEGGS